jgi:transposase-like protein
VRLRNLAEMFLLRGFQFTHEAVRDWEARFAPLLAEQLRRRRKGKVACRWYVNETYLKVKGKWSYLYRAIDGAGNLVDSMLSATRDMATAPGFFRGALADQTGPFVPAPSAPSGCQRMTGGVVSRTTPRRRSPVKRSLGSFPDRSAKRRCAGHPETKPDGRHARRYR